MTKNELITWFKYVKALNKPQTYDSFLEIEDRHELLRLNHLVMELSHNIHNNNMLNNF